MTLLAISRIGALAASSGLAGFGSGASAIVAEMSRQRSLSGSGGAAAVTAAADLFLTRAIEGAGSAAAESEGSIIALTSVSIGGNGDSASTADATMSPIRGLTGAGTAAAEMEGELVPTGVTVAIEGTSSEADDGSGTHVTPFFLYTAANNNATHLLLVLDMFFPKPRIVWFKDMEARDDPNNTAYSNGPDETEKTSIWESTLYIANGFGKEKFTYDFELDTTTDIVPTYAHGAFVDADITPKDETHQNAQYMWFTLYCNDGTNPEEIHLARMDKVLWEIDLFYVLVSGDLTSYGTWPGVTWDVTRGNLLVSANDGTYRRIDPADGSIVESFTELSGRRAIEHREAADDWWAASQNSPQLAHVIAGTDVTWDWNTTDIDPPDELQMENGHFYAAAAISKAIHYVTHSLGGTIAAASAGTALSAAPTLVASSTSASASQADLTNYAWRWLTDGPSGVGTWSNVFDDSWGVGWKAKTDLVVHKMRVWGEGTFSGHISLRVGDPNNVVVTQPVEFVTDQWSEVFAGDYPVLTGEECWVVAHAQGAAIPHDDSADYGQDNFSDLYDGRTFVAEPSATWVVRNANDPSPNAVVDHATGLAEDWIGADIMFLQGTNDSTFMGGSGDGASTMASADMTVIAPTIQWLRPSSDISIGNWLNQFDSTLSLYNRMDEPAPADDDTTYIYDNQSATTYDGHLSDPTSPVGAGDHIFRVRARKDASGGNDRGLTAELMQGGTVIATMSDLNLVETYIDLQLTLTSTQVSNITDYTDLRIRLTSSGTTGGPTGNRRSVRVTFVELEIPA